MSVRYHPRPAVLDRLSPGKHAVIEASAGTGKTFTLEHLVIELILRGTRIENILVVTFTEKATAELVTRVRAKIRALLGPFPSRPGPGSWAIDDAARERLRAALFSFDRASISTIHAFCQRVLTEHAFANRRLFEQQQVDEKASFAGAFKQVLREELARDPAELPYLQAWLRRSTLGDGVASLQALLLGPYLKHCTLEPAFDATALEAALARLASLPRLVVSSPATEALVQHARAWSEHGDTARLLDALDGEKPSGKNRDFLGPLRESRQPEVAEVARLVVPLEVALVQRFLPRVQARLDREKRAAGLFDFQDMLALVRESLDGPHGETLARILRDRYHHALIDEFQDTDAVQWRIFERVFFEAEGRPLYLIGDPKQAIYGFRGADVQTYLEARQRVIDAGGVVVALEENFRSTEGVIDGYNALLRQDVAAPFFDGAIRYDRPVRCGQPSLQAVDRAGRPVAPVVLLELQPTGELYKNGKPRAPGVGLVRAALASRIAREIGALLDGGLRVTKRGELAPIGPEDIFILTRSLSEGYEIGEALREAGVPHAFYKQEGLFQTDEAQHVHDLLAAIDDPHRRARRLRAWLTPFYGLTLEELRASRELAGTHPLLERLLAWKALADEKDYEALFGRILEESGLARRALFLSPSERALTNYLHLFELLLERGQARRATLRELVLELGAYIDEQALPETVDGNVQRLESERKAVQIMTMHKSKGLEAEVVFLYGGLWSKGLTAPLLFHRDGERRAHLINDRDLPDWPSIEAEASSEDQRLLYVALTRARARLYLPSFPSGTYKPTGCYRALNQQVQRVRAEESPLFAVENLSIEAARPAEASLARGQAAWTPPAEMVAPVEPEVDFARLRAAHAGFTITSYTRMKQAQKRATELSVEDFTAEAPSLRPELAENELPAGAQAGIFLHEVLERVRLETFAQARTFDGWRELPPVRELLSAVARKHDREPRHLGHAARLVHTALTAPVELDGARLDGGMAGAARVVREMEFLYPHPEASHPRPFARLPAGGRLEIVRGYVKGFVDVVFEHGGRAFFADWKSDLLLSYEDAALAAHVDEHYRLQAQLYSLALVKLLDIRDAATYEARFGGMLYCFLRGMRSGDGRAGVRFQRPGWDELCGWEEQLVRGELGGAA